MLLLMMMVMYWTQTEGGCSGTLVSILGEDRELHAGEGFNVSCRFTGLRTQHVAQLRRIIDNKEGVSLVNITSARPDVIVVLSISSATIADEGDYYCMTQPPDTISPLVFIRIAALSPANLTASHLTRPKAAECDTTQQPSDAAGLQCQLWFWILLGKIAVLFLSLAALAVKHNRTVNDFCA